MNLFLHLSAFVSPSSFRYCETHYGELFAKRCKTCTKAILGQFVSLADDSWHQECFVCVNCEESLVGQSLFPKEGEYFCKSCYGVLFSPKCPGCNDPIVEGSVLTIQNRKWHADCFVCDYCEGACDVKWFAIRFMLNCL